MSSPVLKPISDCLPVLEMFHNKSYVVPPFQRGYAWKSEQIRELLDDITEFLDGDEPVYLLGQVIVTSSTVPDEYILVDGQQRTTSLLLLLIALQKKFRKIPNFHENDELDYQYSQLNQLIRFAYQGKLQPRVKVSEEGVAYVEGLLRDNVPSTVEGWTQQNLREVYLIITQHIEDNWPNPEEIPSVYEKIVKGIHLVRLELPSYDDAVKVFERINNRGLALSSADLVKNLLFEIVHDDNHKELISQRWAQTAEHLYKCKNNRIRNMEYLLRSLIIVIKGELVSNLEMRDDWRYELRGDVGRAVAFTASLPERAIQLRNLDQGKTPIGTRNEHSQSNRYFNTVQHFPMLLAGAHLNPDAFDVVCKYVEDRTILSLLSKERPQNYEKIVPKWGKMIKNMNPNITVNEVNEIFGEFRQEWQDLLEVSKVNFGLLRTKKSTEKKRIRYMLARISRKVQRDAKTPAIPDLDAMLVTNKSSIENDAVGYDIEHIYPQSLARSDFWVDGVGNLVLAHPRDQRNAQNKNPYEKVNVYLSANLLLTQSLCAEHDFGRSIAEKELPILRRIQEIAPPSLGNWDEQASSKRTELYWQIFISDLAIRPKKEWYM